MSLNENKEFLLQSYKPSKSCLVCYPVLEVMCQEVPGNDTRVMLRFARGEDEYRVVNQPIEECPMYLINKRGAERLQGGAPTK